ncbi:DUF1851 domain-containing protein [Mesorhizobium sp. M1066]|uniref:T6SS immunity protein Tdi1 domain-containing protein n=1 Tax=unclassified Mesorhizobium TaxID=325217 RepID=UPI00333CBFBB
MFETFRRIFPMDDGRTSGADNFPGDPKVVGLNELLTSFGGASFKHGLYRIIRPSDVADWNARVCLGFPEFTERITCFGYDWQGTAFATDTWRLEQGEPGVVMFEPGTGKALQIPANIRTFHEVELIQDEDAALAANIYADWRRDGGAEPSYDQCIGYKKPLFLNGKDAIDNLELSDLTIYWHLMGQIMIQTKDLPQGSPVRVRLS